MDFDEIVGYKTLAQSQVKQGKMSIYHDIFTTLAAYARMAEIFMDFDKVIGYKTLAQSDLKWGTVSISHDIL